MGSPGNGVSPHVQFGLAWFISLGLLPGGCASNGAESTSNAAETTQAATDGQVLYNAPIRPSGVAGQGQMGNVH
jgi:hypothetical protein